MDILNPDSKPIDTGNGESYVNFDWNVFVEKLFDSPPQDPFKFRLEFLEQGMTPQKVSELLGIMLVRGCKILYDKEIAQLEPEEIETIQEYYQSIGFEVHYQVENSIKYVPKYKKTMPVNAFKIDFKPCSQLLDRNNRVFRADETVNFN